MSNPFGDDPNVTSATATLRVDVRKLEGGVVSLNFVAVSPGLGELHLCSGAVQEGDSITISGLKITLNVEIAR